MNLQEKIRNHPKWIELVEQVKKLSYLKGDENEFTLASGRTSSHFFDMKPLMMDPLGSLLLAELMGVYLDELEPEFVVSSQTVPCTAELGLDVPELEELIADRTLLISVLTVGNESLAIL